MKNLDVLRLFPGVAQTVQRSLFHSVLAEEHVDPPRQTKMLRPQSPLVAMCVLFTMSCVTSAQDVGGRQSLELGQHVFLTYCSGCHGFDGLAFYPAAPSFAMGDRLAKSDAELMRSIFRGRGAMPSWENKLPADWLHNALAYIRYMARRGNIGATNNWPDYYYIFAPLGSDLILDWHVPP